MADSAASASPAPLGPLPRVRRLPVGAEPQDGGGTDVRVWAPAAHRVEVVFADRDDPAALTAESSGYFSGRVDAVAGDRYRFRLDDAEQLYPDPASRFQPDGPHGPSVVVNPSFDWSDGDWRGLSREGQVVYEMHVGTFTREGNWNAASRELPELQALGVTVIELMPIAEFEGRFGWGYDGVDLFAPSHLYGTPDDLRRFVDRAHALGIGVILDVVYNHLGPVGNYLRPFSPAYFTDRYDNEWGDAINFDGDDAAPVREFFIANAGYWIDEYHMDGLRLDATQQVFDHSPRNVLLEIGIEVRRRAGGRATMIVAENEPQQTQLVRPEAEGGFALDALWNDDFHHSAMVALTGRAEAYYSDTYGEPQEFVSAAKYGYLYQGQHYDWQRNPRGTPGLTLEPTQFVNYLQNHDQVANSARGSRPLAHESGPLAGDDRAAAADARHADAVSRPGILGLSSVSVLADFDDKLATAVRKGRAEFLTQFPSVRAFEATTALDDPGIAETFTRCKLDFSERYGHADVYALHRDLLRLRRETAAFRAPRRGGVDGAVLSAHAFVLRFFAADGSDRVLIINLGRDFDRRSFAEPLLAPLAGCGWRVEWSSEEPTYGGAGTPDPFPRGRWHIPGESALVLAPTEKQGHSGIIVRRRTA